MAPTLESGLQCFDKGVVVMESQKLPGIEARGVVLKMTTAR